jgi:hypothetical protein
MMIRNACLTMILAAGLAGVSFADSVKTQVKVLSGIFLNGQITRTKTQDPEKMVWRYLYSTYLEEDVKETEFIKNASQIEADSRKAGTLTNDAAFREVMSGIDYMHQLLKDMEESPYPDSVTAEDIKQFKPRAREALAKLIKMGCSFGFDGRRQNEGPTPYLLILDPKGRAVYGFELSPSEF